MRTLFKLNAGVLGLALVIWAASEDRFHWNGHVAAGHTLEIKGINGEVVAEPAGGGQVEVEAWKHARKSNPAEVKIEVVERDGNVTVCAVYPSRDGDKPNRCEPGNGGRMNTHNNDVVVDFRVKVPAGVRFVGKTVNGKIEARGLSGDVEAQTVNGGVAVSTSGEARAETVNGGITASFRKVGRPADFKTVNGGISIELPAGAGAEVDAKTVNGGIHNDFGIAVSGKWGGRHAHGTIGSGGPQLSLETVNGGIEIRKL